MPDKQTPPKDTGETLVKEVEEVKEVNTIKASPDKVDDKVTDYMRKNWTIYKGGKKRKSRKVKKTRRKSTRRYYAVRKLGGTPGSPSNPLLPFGK
jgi:hypothetical protein